MHKFRKVAGLTVPAAFCAPLNPVLNVMAAYALLLQYIHKREYIV